MTFDGEGEVKSWRGKPVVLDGEKDAEAERKLELYTKRVSERDDGREGGEGEREGDGRRGGRGRKRVGREGMGGRERGERDEGVYIGCPRIIRTYDFMRISSLWCNRRSSSFQTFLKYTSRVIDECCIVPRSGRGLVPSPVRLALG